jgi:hypothetical protein
MRQLTDHIVDGDQAVQLQVTLTDEPGAGGANHAYEISWPGSERGVGPNKACCSIHFQNGPIKEYGVNGITQEALLAIVIDRLRSFQAGPFASAYNQGALVECEKALDYLKQRTRERIARGVEGTHTK